MTHRAVTIIMWLLVMGASVGVARFAYVQAAWLWDVHAASQATLDQPFSPEQVAWLGRDPEANQQLLTPTENRRRSDTRVAWLTLAALASWLTLLSIYRLLRICLTARRPAARRLSSASDPAKLRPDAA